MRTLKALHMAEEIFASSDVDGEDLKNALVEFFEGDVYEGLSPEEMADDAQEHILHCRIEKILED